MTVVFWRLIQVLNFAIEFPGSAPLSCLVMMTLILFLWELYHGWLALNTVVVDSTQ